MNFLKFLKSEIDSKLRIFIYKCIIIFILVISIYQYTLGNRLNEIDKLIIRFYEVTDIASQENKERFFHKLQSRLEQDKFLNPEYTKILIKSFNKILKEINQENEKIIEEEN